MTSFMHSSDNTLFRKDNMICTLSSLTWTGNTTITSDIQLKSFLLITFPKLWSPDLKQWCSHLVFLVRKDTNRCQQWMSGNWVLTRGRKRTKEGKAWIGEIWLVKNETEESRRYLFLCQKRFLALLFTRLPPLVCVASRSHVSPSRFIHPYFNYNQNQLKLTIKQNACYQKPIKVCI